MSLLYLDSCCFIYLVEGDVRFRTAVATLLHRHLDQPDARLITSRLSRLECRIGPLRSGDTRLLSLYEGLLAGEGLNLAEITGDVIERATDLRARFGFATPDAIHPATAFEARADIFLTGDATLSRCTDLHVEVLSL